MKRTIGPNKNSESEETSKIIFNEIKSRINENDKSLPIKDGKYQYLTETKKGLQYSIVKRKIAGKSNSRYRTIIDWNIISKKFKYFKPGGISYSNNQKIFNYSYDDKRSEFFQLRPLRWSVAKKIFQFLKIQAEVLFGQMTHQASTTY